MRNKERMRLVNAWKGWKGVEGMKGVGIELGEEIVVRSNEE